MVRASTGTLFALPVVEAGGEETRSFLRARGFALLAATPHAERLHTAVKLTGNVALVLGSEQYGLSDGWLKAADLKVRIPMLGMADSLNVAAAATILLFEAVRQRIAAGMVAAPVADQRPALSQTGATPQGQTSTRLWYHAPQLDHAAKP